MHVTDRYYPFYSAFKWNIFADNNGDDLEMEGEEWEIIKYNVYVVFPIV